MKQNLDEYDGLYIPGGHGAMVDFPDNAKLQQVIATMFSKGAPVHLPPAAPPLDGRSRSELGLAMCPTQCFWFYLEQQGVCPVRLQ